MVAIKPLFFSLTLESLYSDTTSLKVDPLRVHHLPRQAVSKEWHSSPRILSPLTFSRRPAYNEPNICDVGTESQKNAIIAATADAAFSSIDVFPPLSHISGVIFDMDGTILKPAIDFAYMREQVHSIAAREVEDGTYPSSSPRTERVLKGDVLELYGYLSPEGRKRAAAIFAEVERRALNSMEPAEGVVALLNYVSSFPGMKRAVLTRNVSSTVEIMEKFLKEAGCLVPFDTIVARDTDPDLATKPAPDPIFYICDIWGVKPHNVVMVGDTAADDIVAGNRAGVRTTVLIDTKEDNCSGGKRPEEINETEYEKLLKPTVTVLGLEELMNLWLEAEQRESL
uniref:Phosphoglycolate phosphatase n=1 Tax=Corethron hystrix TaxID=216773 RepID=A0A7S1FUA2_9STRA|mmetsp:Transcript_28349/g.64849  ORF Transcript_28349/g.64849 Transcript_28349/m.64849 type:complete len:340 (+) Transcript_28349:116-1135(+)